MTPPRTGPAVLGSAEAPGLARDALAGTGAASRTGAAPGAEAKPRQGVAKKEGVNKVAEG